MSRRRNIELHPNLIKSEALCCEKSIQCYKENILNLYAKLEDDSNSSLNPIMIDNQPEIKWTMRPFLMDFLIELHIFFDLSPEALFLASSITDRYCSKRIVYKRHYQLLIATSLWIAAKYQDKKSRVPTLKELYLLCYQIYDPQMFVQMERHILTTLEWSISNNFSINECLTMIFDQNTILSRDIEGNDKLFQMSSFLLDLSLYQRNYMLFSTSTRTISAVLLASKILGQTLFSDYVKLIITGLNNYQENSNGDDCTGSHTEYKFPFKFIAGDNNNETMTLDLDLSKSDINGIRNCTLVYLNDLFKEKIISSSSISSNQAEKYKISKVLLKKYEALSIKEYINSFISEEIELYIHLKNLIESMTSMKKNNSFIQPWVSNTINMFIDYFIGLQEISYDEDETNYGGPIDETNTTIPLTRNQTPMELNDTLTPLSKLSSITTPVPLRSTSSLSEISNSNVSSRSSSIFSQPVYKSDSPQFIDSITPVSATSVQGVPLFNSAGMYGKPRSKTVTSMSSIGSKTSSLSFINPVICHQNQNSSIPPTPSFNRHKANTSFSSIAPSNLFSIGQSPVITSNNGSSTEAGYSRNIGNMHSTLSRTRSHNWSRGGSISNPVDSLAEYKFFDPKSITISGPQNTGINTILDLDQSVLQKNVQK